MENEEKYFEVGHKYKDVHGRIVTLNAIWESQNIYSKSFYFEEEGKEISLICSLDFIDDDLVEEII